MKINNIDIKDYNAELIDRVISTTRINSHTDWMDEAAEGIVLRQAYDWRTITLTFVVKENHDEDNAYRRVSALTEALKDCTIRFDDINLDFRCVLDGTTQPERLQNGVFRVVFSLKNDWGRGDKITKEWIIDHAAGKMIKVNFVRNWVTTMEGYTACFNENEQQEQLGSEEIYVDLSLVEQLAERNTSWSGFFLELGIPVNKYKQPNELNGFLDIDTAYSAEGAKHVLDNRNTFTIYYNRYHKDGYPDFPGPKTYPSLVWQTGNQNNYYFSCGVGTGWNVQDISVVVTGRWYQASAANLGSMFGAYSDNYGLTLKGSTAYYDMMGKSYAHTVINEEGSSTGNGIAIGTLEDLASLPLREYAIKSSKEGASPVAGYVDCIFNGVTLTRYDCANAVLTQDITIGIGHSSHEAVTKPAINCDIARARIYYKGQLVRDLLPIDGNLKNCFINTWDTGFYDIISMTYVPWCKWGGEDLEFDADAYLHIPGTPDQPLPPPAPDTYLVTVVNGTGSGNYEKGAIVTISANEPADSTLEFNKWVINTGTITLTQPDTALVNTFAMPEEEVTITATYKEKEPDITPAWHYYSNLADVESETKFTVGQNSPGWNGTVRAGLDFYAVFSVPGAASDVYGMTLYPSGTSSKTLRSMGSGVTSNDRYYVRVKVNGSIGNWNAYIKIGYDGKEVTQNFYVNSLF